MLRKLMLGHPKGWSSVAVLGLVVGCANDPAAPEPDSAGSSSSAVEAEDPGAATGNGIEPVYYPGNPTCSDLAPEGATWYELKYEPVVDGNDSDGTLDVSIDEYTITAGQVFDWSSNIGVDAVFVKGGDNGDSYVYDPPSESMGDTALHAPVNPSNGKYYGLSHISFCYDIVPSVKIDKGGDTLSKVGDPVTYTFAIQNDGDLALSLTSVSDTLLGDLTATATAAGCGWLAAGDDCYFEYIRVVQPGDSDPLPNTVTASYEYTDPEDNTGSVWDDDYHEVNLFQPAIRLAKNGDDLSKEGLTIDYAIKIWNESSADSPDLECTLTDPLTGMSENITFGPGEMRTFNVPYVVPTGAPDPLVNTVSASCSPQGFPNIIEDEASHETNLFQPSLKLTKTGSPYSKVGDTVYYEVTIENTSSADTPDLALSSFSDSLVSVTPPSSCDTLASGQSCSFDYSYVVQPGDDSGAVGAKLSNTAAADYSITGFSDCHVNAQDIWMVTLLHPSFTVQKVCTTDPAPQEGPAWFKVTISNTGDVELIVSADDGIGNFNLPVGQTEMFDISVDGPFDGQASIANTVNASWTLPEWTGLSNTRSASDSATCTVAGIPWLRKKTDGAVDPSRDWSFAIYDGPNADSGAGTGDSSFLGSPLAADSSYGAADGVLDFGDLPLDPSATYTICELGLPAGWIGSWMIDTDDDGVPDTAVDPYNPNASDNPAQDVGNRCLDIGAGTNYPTPAGGQISIEVDNLPPPGGDARTPGYWKNWNTCTKGNQAETAAKNGGPDAGYWLLDDILAMGPITWGNFSIATCEDAVRVLNQRDLNTGKKRANDGAYGLAMHLLAAQLNFAAGASTCAEANDVAAQAEALLVSLDFDGSGMFLRPRHADYATARELEGLLDEYNNNLLCAP